MSLWQAGSLFISNGRVLAANYKLIIANGTEIADTREFRYMQGPAQQQLIPKYEQVRERVWSVDPDDGGPGGEVTALEFCQQGAQ